LSGLAGRPVGGAESFDYSPVFKAAKARGLRWDRERLLAFLEDPEAMFPGLWMSAQGLRRAEERAAVADFLLGAR